MDFPKGQAIEIIEQYTQEYITNKILIIGASTSFLNGKIKNLAKYLKIALEQDYQTPKSSRLFASAKKEVQNGSLAKDQLIQYEKFINVEIMDVFLKLNEDKRNAVLVEFEPSINNTLYATLYQTKGLNDPLVAARFFNFVMSKQRDWYKPSVSFAAFSKQERWK